MADTKLSDRLRAQYAASAHSWHYPDMLEAAAELDRREAIVAAAEAWAKAEREWERSIDPVVATTVALAKFVEAREALLALLPTAALKG